jgi:predicted Fe-Mo cluster-binding NifX family protein
MKIACVTDDHQTISAHFGRAQFYEVFTIEDGKVTLHETFAKENHHKVVTLDAQPEAHREHGGHDEHHHQHDHNAMIAPIADCKALLTRGMGTGAYNSLKEHGIEPIITDIREIEAAVEAYLAGTIIHHPEKLH